MSKNLGDGRNHRFFSGVEGRGFSACSVEQVAAEHYLKEMDFDEGNFHGLEKHFFTFYVFVTEIVF